MCSLDPIQELCAKGVVITSLNRESVGDSLVEILWRLIGLVEAPESNDIHRSEVVLLLNMEEEDSRLLCTDSFLCAETTYSIKRWKPVKMARELEWISMKDITIELIGVPEHLHSVDVFQFLCKPFLLILNRVEEEEQKGKVLLLILECDLL